MSNEDRRKRQMYAEAFGMGDIKVGLITGQYPNTPIKRSNP
jgi:hypothetical protein